VISYGKERPIAPNKTRNGRAQNRRVVIKVLT
jgi:peptidoglycan-associated lipoprotein